MIVSNLLRTKKRRRVFEISEAELYNRSGRSPPHTAPTEHTQILLYEFLATAAYNYAIFLTLHRLRGSSAKSPGSRSFWSMLMTVGNRRISAREIQKRSCHMGPFSTYNTHQNMRASAIIRILPRRCSCHTSMKSRRGEAVLTNEECTKSIDTRVEPT